MITTSTLEDSRRLIPLKHRPSTGQRSRALRQLINIIHAQETQPHIRRRIILIPMALIAYKSIPLIITPTIPRNRHIAIKAKHPFSRSWLYRLVVETHVPDAWRGVLGKSDVGCWRGGGFELAGCGVCAEEGG